MASIDTSIYPHASGAAADFAAKHSEPQPLRLYGGWFCPFVQRAWMVLHEKRIPHQYIEINPYKKDKELLDLNPRGLIPTLRVPPPEGQEDGKPRALYESIVVCEYLDEAYGDAESRLLPSDVYERARCRLWIDHVASRIVPGFYKFIQHTPDKPYSINEVRNEFLGHIKTFVEAMDREGPWFLGEKFSLVDVSLAPWAKRLFLIDHYKPGGVEIPDPDNMQDDEQKAVWKRWKVWYDAISERPSVKDTLSESEQYIKVYHRYADDTTQSLVGQATRQGGRLP
ncbi:hypothetical protein jhhlp_002688 [Lomentospora prolificans]|uniref:GST N-terminal domain-containing protein n=1 Tax=Lomentospora prolificans TaxID=41688 RepID=A0A2N3NEQ5_9PEZI|nr:hypothetical protein jhhlp_002688 [Lomentospora prolificans]